MTNTENRQHVIEMLSELIGDIPVAMLVTCTAQHSLRSRPMVNVNQTFEGDLWFFTHEQDPKVNEVTGNPQVNVSFSSPARNCFVSVSGSAALVRDPKRAELLWTEACEKWFPNGQQDPDLALLRIEVDYAEYWDEKKRVMQKMSGLLKHALTGGPDEQDAVEHEKIDWQPQAKAPGVDR